MILVNGEYKSQIDVTDRGLLYGDGLFETIEVIDSQPVFLKQHLARLSEGCVRLKIPPPNNNEVSKEALRLCEGVGCAVLKIIVTRGAGGRGYRLPDSVQPSRILSLHPLPDYPKAYCIEGVNTRFCETRLGLNPALAGLKHLNRLEQVMARSEWNNADMQEGFLSDFNGHIIEGTMSNLFFVKNNSLYTPSLALSGVAGIVRAIIQKLCHANKLDCIEVSISKEILLAADELFICNSLIGIWPVRCLDKATFPVGTVTKQVQQWFNEFRAKDRANVY